LTGEKWTGYIHQLAAHAEPFSIETCQEEAEVFFLFLFYFLLQKYISSQASAGRGV